jgi:hypothetical protein
MKTSLFPDSPRGKDLNGMPLKIHTGKHEFQSNQNMTSICESSFDSKLNDSSIWHKNQPKAIIKPDRGGYMSQRKQT